MSSTKSSTIANVTKVSTPEDDDVQAIDVLFDLTRSLGRYPSEDELTEQAASMLSSPRRNMTLLNAQQLAMFKLFMSKSGIPDFEDMNNIDAWAIATAAVDDVSSRESRVVDPILEARGFIEAIEEYGECDIDVCEEKLEDIAELIRKTEVDPNRKDIVSRGDFSRGMRHLARVRHELDDGLLEKLVPTIFDACLAGNFSGTVEGSAEKEDETQPGNTGNGKAKKTKSSPASGTRKTGKRMSDASNTATPPTKKKRPNARTPSTPKNNGKKPAIDPPLADDDVANQDPMPGGSDPLRNAEEMDVDLNGDEDPAPPKKQQLGGRASNRMDANSQGNMAVNGPLEPSVEIHRPNASAPTSDNNDHGFGKDRPLTKEPGTEEAASTKEANMDKGVDKEDVDIDAHYLPLDKQPPGTPRHRRVLLI